VEMSPVAKGRVRRLGPGDRGEYFLPDLCGPRQVFVLVLLAELLVLVFTLAAGGLRHFDWSLLALVSLFVQWIALCSAALLCLLRGLFERFGTACASGASLALIALVTVLSSLASRAVMPLAQPFATDGWALLRNLLVALVVGGIALRYCYLQQQLRLRERSVLQARLDALRARIRPHFLFNTLNSIASLIATQPEQAERAVEDLAELFRGSLREASQTLTVADEIRLCSLYLDIEQLRLGSRLRVDWQVGTAVRDLPMPSLVLQPLVENAVYHGVARLAEGGCIEVRIARRDGLLHVHVSNPVPQQETDGGLRIALDNIVQRLRGQYGERAGLEAARRDEAFRVHLFYPCEPREGVV
ncbi:MAG: sensor histidine kinase, partial [Parahaliea sp.]